MANTSAALNSLASTTVIDFFRPMAPQHSEEFYLKTARFATVGWGVVLVAIGILARHWGEHA